MTSSSDFNHVESEHLMRDYVVHIKEIVIKELESKLDVPATIFQLHNSVKQVKPEVYTPQLIGLGPFHHFRAELSHMQKDKFINTVKTKEEKLSISGGYNKLFNLDPDDLVWMTVIDALLLLELLSEKFKSSDEHQGEGYEYPVAGKELVQNAILRDVMMLENQIPLILLHDIAKKMGSSSRAIPQRSRANHVSCKTLMEVARTHVLARYVKLMDGILDSAADVKILKQENIIKSTLESDEDVAKLFGGMSISIGLAADDEIIQQVKKFYDGSRRIQRLKLMNRCCSVFYSCLKFIVVILLLALMALQSYCSVYSCARIMN
ncbi:hypothetical protein HS088_TW04G00056 [Tripterygium wilfordii]|uniref:Uncharacterized protein n=1 Tax=Tripterygium wilfordii TaxID=458696 RepID=A0A7J7DPT8_TRIWF|nr:hypothetical protein HS088_TW04G00056 [Tripterygium wilfordii]